MGFRQVAPANPESSTGVSDSFGGASQRCPPGVVSIDGWVEVIESSTGGTGGTAPSTYIDTCLEI